MLPESPWEGMRERSAMVPDLMLPYNWGGGVRCDFRFQFKGGERRGLLKRSLQERAGGCVWGRGAGTKPPALGTAARGGEAGSTAKLLI